MEKWRPWERKVKIGENVLSKSLVEIMEFVYLRCSSGVGGQTGTSPRHSPGAQG